MSHTPNLDLNMTTYGPLTHLVLITRFYTIVHSLYTINNGIHTHPGFKHDYCVPKDKLIRINSLHKKYR